MTNFVNHSNYNCVLGTDDGQTFKVYANWLHNQGLDQWQGWKCQAGATRLMIDKYLMVYGGECRNDHLGHALHDFDLLNETTCRKQTCTGCTDDLIVTKRDPSND